ncbi:unnamed protein product [Clonostachys rosea]|uniref:Uncharacterized protein n=1 Tax=Bionectria ochroleuca TaxID=29856 RepID=A0ABY6TVG4_BIOOC|nr:unnamed protein product [Clonostachys rosea]
MGSPPLAWCEFVPFAEQREITAGQAPGLAWWQDRWNVKQWVHDQLLSVYWWRWVRVMCDKEIGRTMGGDPVLGQTSSLASELVGGREGGDRFIPTTTLLPDLVGWFPKDVAQPRRTEANRFNATILNDDLQRSEGP